MYKDDHMSDDEKINRIIEDINAKKGCRMKGFFEIDRVPGNFHLSCHGYGNLIHRLVNQGYRNILIIQVCWICRITFMSSDSDSKNLMFMALTAWKTLTLKKKLSKFSWESLIHTFWISSKKIQLM